MNIPDNVKEIVRRLKSRGDVYYCGGFVRDMLLEKNTAADIDLVTSLKPKEIEALFADKKVDKIGVGFSVTVVDNIEISTYRKDVYFGNVTRKGADSVEYADSLEEDLGRRDITINSLALDPNGTIIDPFGGMEDIEKRNIKFVLDPNERIREDPCRMIRACRFCGTIDGTMSPDTIKAIKANAPLIQLVARERIRTEVLKIMEQDDITKSIRAMEETEILSHIFPPLSYCQGFKQNKHHGEDVLEHLILSASAVSKRRPLLRLGMLLHDIGKPLTREYYKDIDDYRFLGHEDAGEIIARDYLINGKYSAREINHICEIIRFHMWGFSIDTKQAAVRRLMSKLKHCDIDTLVRARIADRKGNKAKAHMKPITAITRHTIKLIRKIRKEENALSIKDLKIDGHDLAAMELQKGPIYSKIFKALLEKVIKDPSFNKKELLLEEVKKLIPMFTEK